MNKSHLNSVMKFESKASLRVPHCPGQGTPVFTRRRMTKAPYRAKDTNAAEPMANPCTGPPSEKNMSYRSMSNVLFLFLRFYAKGKASEMLAAGITVHHIVLRFLLLWNLMLGPCLWPCQWLQSCCQLHQEHQCDDAPLG